MSGVIRFVTDDAGAGASGDTMSENAAAKPASAVAAVAISDVVMVSPQETRVEPVRASSPSWFVARINAVSRIIGALLLCIPMFISLDAVSASTAQNLAGMGCRSGQLHFRVPLWTYFRRDSVAKRLDRHQ